MQNIFVAFFISAAMLAVTICTTPPYFPQAEIIPQKELGLDGEDFERLIVAMIETQSELEKFPHVEKSAFHIDGKSGIVEINLQVDDSANDKNCANLKDDTARLFLHKWIDSYTDVATATSGGGRQDKGMCKNKKIPSTAEG